jgi:hypothetical protein
LEKDPEDRPESATEIRKALVALSIEFPWSESWAAEWWADFEENEPSEDLAHTTEDSGASMTLTMSDKR